MNGIEKYIKENIGESDVVPVPEGSRNAFMRKVEAERRRRAARSIVLAFSSMAAAAALAVSFLPDSLSHDIERHHKRLAVKEMEILAVISENSPELMEEVTNTIRVVVSEAIPLEEQLPDVIGDKVKKEILKEYYDSKYRALEQILDQYTNIY